MSLQLPNLDDLSYQDLVQEALRLIPAYAPQWTNHNPSDPGVTLLELFAYLSEAMLYRLNRVTPASQLSFLKLLNGSRWEPCGKKPEELKPDEILREIPGTIRRLRRLERAVTRQDFETLALEASPDVARVHCLPRRNLEFDLASEREDHVSMIVLPIPEAEARVADVLSDVRAHLTPRLLLTTRLHVVKPFFVEVTINTVVALKSDQIADTEQDLNDVRARIRSKIEQFFSPHFDPAQNTGGWMWGRNVFTSEVFALLDRLPFIDYAQAVELSADFPKRELPNKSGIEVKPHELVKIAQVDVKFLKAQAARGGQETNDSQ